MEKSIYSVISVILVSMVSLVGIFFLSIDTSGEKGKFKLFDSRKYNRALPFLVSFAVGALFGDAFIHLLPEAFESLGADLNTSFNIIAGLVFFFSLEKFVRWEHCHDLDIDGKECAIHSTATMVLIGDSIHNLIDGMLIGASYAVSIPMGVTTTLAVFLHEIPQEIGDFGVLIHSGYTVKKALILNLLTGLTAVLGVIISLLLGPVVEGYANNMLPFTAGGFIYIAGSDLIPELHSEYNLKSSILQLVSMLLGIFIMALLTLL